MWLQMTQKEMDNMRHKYYHALVLIRYESYVFRVSLYVNIGTETRVQ